MIATQLLDKIIRQPLTLSTLYSLPQQTFDKFENLMWNVELGPFTIANKKSPLPLVFNGFNTISLSQLSNDYAGVQTQLLTAFYELSPLYYFEYLDHSLI